MQDTPLFRHPLFRLGDTHYSDRTETTRRKISRSDKCPVIRAILTYLPWGSWVHRTDTGLLLQILLLGIWIWIWIIVVIGAGGYHSDDGPFTFPPFPLPSPFPLPLPPLEKYWGGPAPLGPPRIDASAWQSVHLAKTSIMY